MKLLANNKGNGHQTFFNPVRVFLQLLSGLWEKRDMVNDETYLINSDDVKDNLEDMSEEEPEEVDNDRN
ncbi:MAG: hypothetical protein SAL70_12505 [Scytonema sp. PMC 1070.18]|nr:hypothetical protein [Scytonema sp. PMC 1070.18]